FDQYVALELLYFFNPILTSLNGLLQASALDKVRKTTGSGHVSKGSFSEAQGIFAAPLLEGIIAELAERVAPVSPAAEWAALKDLTAVDGSLLPALPKMAWALWLDEEHRAAKLHLQFDVFKGVPRYATVTDGNGNEKKELRASLQAALLYVIDRGYAEYRLFQDILDAKSSFIGRIRDNAVYQLVEERPLS